MANDQKFETLPGAKEWASSPLCEELIKRINERIARMLPLANAVCPHCSVLDESKRDDANQAKGVIAGMQGILTSLTNARGDVQKPFAAI